MAEPTPQRGLQRIAGAVGGLAACTVAVVTRRVDSSTVVSSARFTSRGRRGAIAAEHRGRVDEQADTVDHAIGPVVVVEGLAAHRESRRPCPVSGDSRQVAGPGGPGGRGRPGHRHT